MRIALIEDDDLHAEVVGRWLTREASVRLERFRSPTEFFTDLANRTDGLPDVVFVDYHLGDTTGAEFVAETRSLGDARADIGIVLLSGLDISEFNSVLNGLDVDGFLLKDDLSRERLAMVAGLAVQSARRRQKLATFLRG
ncbi:response regulator [Donghicola sp. C2-DW-16]|uniref:Response regulator n=1 Tax=Donghicola mangrovi TaxID=2729614 RepID=A0ABX2PAX4_9RHOB|nr:response regulator [Donghicola mangrovi]NVO26633.1 response regulator [Donghicola mangrovi]